MQIARLWSKECQRVVAPVVTQALIDKIAVVDEGVNRQQLRASDTERSQIGRDVRVGQSSERTALGFRHHRMQLGKAFDMHLVEDGPFPRGLRFAESSPRECRINNAALLHKRGTVAFVE